MKKRKKRRISVLSVVLAMTMVLTSSIGYARAEGMSESSEAVQGEIFESPEITQGEMSESPDARAGEMSESLGAAQAGEMSESFEAALAEVALHIDQEYAVVGTPLTVTLDGAPQDTVCKYQWKVGGTVKSTGDTYTPTASDLEKMLTVTVTASGSHTGTYQASMYISKLPVLYVDTENGQAITSKEDYINGNFRIQGNDAYNSANTTLYDGAIKIRGRGNSTWQNPKKPYKIKLDKKTDIFGFGKNKHWVLLANYTDESHMRNMLSYNLSGSMGMPYMQTVHVDLILNGKYQGTYQFCEQIKVADGRVNIQNWEDYAGDVAKAVYKKESANGLTKDDQDAIETQLAEQNMGWLTTKKFTYQGKEYNITDYLADMPDATGGFLIELDAYYDEYSKFTTSQGQPLQFKNPEFIATNPMAMEYVQDYINAFEKAIQSSDYTTTYNNRKTTYSQLFDMDSLTQFWLVSELFMNVDAMKKSTYMYKDVDGLFHMGPIWDMDWSSNSLVSNYEGSGKYDVWQTNYFSAQAQGRQWYKSIIRDPYFAVQAYELYTQMREELGSIVADGGKMDTCQALLQESADANAAMWYGRDSRRGFATQTETLKTYLKNRLNWLDKQFQSPETLAASLGYRSANGITINAEDITIQQDGTAIITANVTNTAAKTVEFLINGKNLGTAEISNQKAAIEVPSQALLPTSNYNTVQVFALNANNTVITSGSDKVTDYAIFHAELPENPDPDKPENPDPDKPENPDPDKPENPDPDKPENPDPDKPENPDPDKPENPDPDKPENPDPDKPENPDPDKPENPDPDKPENPDPDKPENPDSDKPENPDPDKPENPDPDKPENPDPDKPENPDPDKPGNPEPGIPVEPNPDKPGNPNPDVPAIKAPAVGKVLSDTKGKAQYKVTKSALKGGTVEYYRNKNAKATSIKIPATVTIGKITYKVTSIAEKALKANKKITKVTIGSNITQIKKNTFSQCTKLKAITLGKNITSIGDKAFYKCTALTKIVIPDKVTKIGKQSFYGCKKLAKALIPAKVKSIGSKAFANTPNLKSITIKTTRLTSKSIGSNAFQKANSQATVKVPAKKLKAYKSLLKKRGITGKKQKIIK